MAKLAVPAALLGGAVLFVGGVVIGWARYSRLPGSYMVIADSRSVEPIGRADARWAREQLGLENRVVADRANNLLWGGIGLQNPQGGEIIGRNVPRVITAPTVDPNVKYALVADALHYLVVDLRLATGLPAVGVYFEQGEPGANAHKHPPARSALLKYDRVCPVGRMLDSGPIVVYDTRRIDEQFDCDIGPGPPSSVVPHGGAAPGPAQGGQPAPPGGGGP